MSFPMTLRKLQGRSPIASLSNAIFIHLSRNW